MLVVMMMLMTMVMVETGFLQLSHIYFCRLPFYIALLGVTSTSGYQMVVNVGETKQIKDMAISSLQVKPFDNKLPVKQCLI